MRVCVRVSLKLVFDYELTYIITAYKLSQFELEVKKVIKKIQKAATAKGARLSLIISKSCMTVVHVSLCQLEVEGTCTW